MPKPELLAPAGSPEALTAALRCGADAVYLGGGAHNARGSAQNFGSAAALAEAGHACRMRGVRLYFTLNTLLGDRELPEALALAREAAQAGADALIVQDLGLMNLLRESLPQIHLHASTQCSVQTAQGMTLLKTLGCSRAVLPRECTRDELADLVNTAPLELEAFVHGAQCMSLSGQCLMSAALGGRSGNRGSCAQPCRLAWGEGHALSLKDLSLLQETAAPPLNQMAGLKLEGRQKRPEYVAAAVSAFRAALDGTPPPITPEELRQTFSRSGFTQGYFTALRGPAMFGARQKEDLASPALLERLRNLYKKETQSVPLIMHFTGKINAPIRLRVSALGKTVTAEGDILQPAQARPLSEDILRQQLQKLGGTVFYAQSMQIILPKGGFLPLRSINSLRRSAIAALEAALTQVPAVTYHPIKSPGLPRRNPQKPLIYLRFLHHEQIPGDLPAHAKIFLPCETAPEILRLHRAQVTVPTGIFGAADAVLAQLRRAKNAGVSEAMVHTLDGAALALEAGLLPVAGEGMNLCNSASLAAAAELGFLAAVLSAEISAAQARGLQSPLPIGTLVYGRLQLMLCRVCPVKAQQGCGEDCSLTDRKGIRFPVRCRGGCAAIYNSRPIWLADVKNRLPPLDFHLFTFTVEPRKTCEQVLQAWKNNAPAPDVFTRSWLKQTTK